MSDKESRRVAKQVTTNDNEWPFRLILTVEVGTAEAVVCRFSSKSVFLKILQYPQENIHRCVGVPFQEGDANTGVLLWILWNF